MSAGVGTIARLTWKRLWRGRAVWVAIVLAGLPLLFGAVVGSQETEPAEMWRLAATFALRLPLMLAVALLLAPALGEEIDARTYTYLWSRPLPRHALLFGKMVALAPPLAAVFVASVALTFPITLGPVAGEHLDALARALAAVLGAVLGTSAVALGIGTLFARHPFVIVLGYVLGIEQLLPFVPTLRSLSVAYHVTVIADADASFGTTLEAVVSLLFVAAIWLGVAVWRVGRVELLTKES